MHQPFSEYDLIFVNCNAMHYWWRMEDTTGEGWIVEEVSTGGGRSKVHARYRK
jgi:hypothetical protein